MKFNNKLFLFCFALSAFMGLSIDMLVSSLPDIAKDFNESPNKILLVIGFFISGYGFGQLFYGVLSDYIDRRRALIIGLIIFILSSLGCILSSSLNTLIFFRFIQSLGACSATISTFAIARDHFSGKSLTQCITFISIGLSFFPVLFASMGGYINQFLGWHAIFLFAMLYAGILLLLVCTNMQWFLRRKVSFHISTLLGQYKQLIKSQNYWAYTLCSCTIFIVIIYFLSIAPFILKTQFNFSANKIGNLIALNSLCLVLGSSLLTYLNQRYGLKTIINLASVIMILAGIILYIDQFLDNNKGHFLPIMYFASIGLGLIMPAAQSGLLQEHQAISAQAAGLAGFLRFSLATVAAYILVHFNGNLLVLSFMLIGLGSIHFLILAKAANY